MSSTTLELLQAMPLFGAIRDDTLEFLLERSNDVSVARDEYFFRENDQGSSMFVLEAGRVAVFKSWVDQIRQLAVLGRGDCFGEMALVEMVARSASVQALDDCAAIELPIDILHELYRHDLEQFAIIQMNMSREISRRLRKADDRLFQVQMRDGPGDPGEQYYWG